MKFRRKKTAWLEIVLIFDHEKLLYKNHKIKRVATLPPKWLILFVLHLFFKEKSGPLCDFRIKTKLRSGKSEKKQEAPTVIHQCIFGRGCVIALLITVYLMRPSGHVSSHSENPARLHCWTRLQESNVQSNVVEGHLHSQHETRRLFWSI